MLVDQCDEQWGLGLHVSLVDLSTAVQQQGQSGNAAGWTNKIIDEFAVDCREFEMEMT